jgi:hypothetical protein
MQIANTSYTYANTFLAATHFANRGWSVTPVRFRTKKPILRDWPVTEVEEEDFQHHFSSGPINIGIVLGEPSKGLVDVDIDDSGALKLAADFFPSTSCIFGRATNPCSHRIYLVPSPGRISDFVADGETLLELRGNKHFTVFPGSVHESGEAIEFEQGLDGDPGETEWSDLEKAARKTAVATLLFKNWKEGTDAALSAHWASVNRIRTSSFRRICSRCR